MYGRRTILVKKGVNVLNWLDKLERKFGRYAIPNLTVYLLAGYVIGFAVYYLAPNLLRYLTLEPYYILHGQIWRIISWVLIPPTGSLFSLFFLVLLLSFTAPYFLDVLPALRMIRSSRYLTPLPLYGSGGLNPLT